MVPNTGLDEAGWWYYYGISGSEVSTLLSQNSARLLSIQYASSSTFNVVMIQCNCGVWWWDYGYDAAGIEKLYAQDGSRIVSIDTYNNGNTLLFAVVMNDNSNEITSRVRGILAEADGAT